MCAACFLSFIHILSQKVLEEDFMRSLSPLSRRILKKAGIAAAFFCSAFLFGSVLSHFTCRALRKAAPVFLSAAPETPVSSVSMPVLSSAAENWGLSFPEKGKTPVGNATSEELAAYNAWFAASPEENIIYLTFDCGYENGNTPAILDALQKHQTPAAFFVVGNFLSDQPDLVKRMAAEGHIVGNHTWSHPDMSKISTQEAFSEELNRVSALYQETTSQEMVKYYRPPQEIQHAEPADGKRSRLSDFFLESCLCRLVPGSSSRPTRRLSKS